MKKMMTRKRNVPRLCALLLLLALVTVGCRPGARSDSLPERQPSEEPTTALPTVDTPDERDLRSLTFVSINDLHGYIEKDSSGKGGLAGTAAGIAALSRYRLGGTPGKAPGDDLVLFANGDMFQGTALSNMSRGEAVIAAMNEMGFVGMGVGNHEFDWGFEEITGYFDGDETNGEANFPLLSCNVRRLSTGRLEAEADDGDNFLPYLLTEREGVKIGIISAIGPCRNSILQSAVADFDFDDVFPAVKSAAIALKEQGAELISVNIHYGDEGGVERYDVNRALANLKDAAGNYLIDLIFNGHTHTVQSGKIVRQGGADVPIVQAGGNNSAFGYIRVFYDKTAGKVDSVTCGTRYVSSITSAGDPDVERVIDDYATAFLNALPTLAVSAKNVYGKEAVYDYIADVMIRTTGSDYALSNTGGVRSVRIDKGQRIRESDIYEIVPFDNEVYTVEIKGRALYDLYSADDGHYYFGVSDGLPAFSQLKDSDDYYTLAIIDYVYTGNYFTGSYRDYTPYIRKAENTDLCLRDLLRDDVALFGAAGEEWDPAKGSRSVCRIG